MASVERHEQPRSSGPPHVSWRVSWLEPGTGRRVRRSFPSEEQAAAFRDRMAGEEQHGSGLPPVAELRRPVQRDDVDVISEHLRWCAFMGKAQGTIAQRRCRLRWLSHWLASQPGHPTLLSATALDLRAWQLSLEGTALNTRAASVKNARAFYRWASTAEMVDHRLIEQLRAPRIPERLPRPIRPDDLSGALAGAPARLKPWLLLAAYTGARACEIAPMRAEDLDLHGAVPMVVIRHGKGGKQRAVPLSGPLVAALMRCALPSRGWLFPGQTRRREPNGTHVSASQVSHLCSRYLHESGSVSTLHALRHSFATEAYRNSLDVRLVQDLLGHASPAMTAKYTAIATGRVVDVVNQVGRSLGEVHTGKL